MPAPRAASIRRVVVGLALLAAANLAVLAIPRLPTLPFAAEDDAGEWSPSSGRGLLRRAYHDERGNERRYVVFAPLDLKPGDRPPVMLFLCGLGEYGDDGLRHLTGTLGPQLWDQRTRFPFVVVFPQCRAGGSWSAGSPDVQWAMGMLDAAAAEFGADPDRVYLTGISSGGVGAWAVATAYPDRFAAVAPLCGAPSAETAAVLAEARLPVWNFVNSRDDKSLVAANRDIYDSLLAAGVSPTFTEVPGDGHDSWNYAYRNPALYDWLLGHSRSGNAQNESRFELIFDGASMAGWTHVAEGIWRVDAERSLVVETAEATASSRIVSEKAFGDLELHFDFHVRDEGGFRLSFVEAMSGAALPSPLAPLPEGEGGTGGGWALEIVPSVKGSGGLRDAGSGRYLQPSDPLGQLQLKSNSWNDLRIKLFNGRLTAWLNNWKLLDYSAEDLPATDRRIAYELIGHGPQRVAFRNVRVNEAVTAEP